jgi:hypothetical protein
MRYTTATELLETCRSIFEMVNIRIQPPIGSLSPGFGHISNWQTTLDYHKHKFKNSVLLPHLKTYPSKVNISFKVRSGPFHDDKKCRFLSFLKNSIIINSVSKSISYSIKPFLALDLLLIRLV